MSLRTKSTSSSKQEETLTLKTSSSDEEDNNDSSSTSHSAAVKPYSSPPASPSSSPATLRQRAISQTLASTANLANLLPTGTLLAFQLLTPVFTNNGACDAATRPLTLILLLLLAFSCLLFSFTDSFKAADGRVYYGVATLKGLWLFDYADESGSRSGLPDLRKYRLRFIDGVHAVLAVLVFVAVAMRDRNVVKCFYPQPAHETEEVLNIVPVGIGIICSLLFMAFPTTRHGIGYPVSNGPTKHDS